MIQTAYASPRLVLIPSSPELAEQVSAYYEQNRDFLKVYEPARSTDFFSVAEQKKLLLADCIAAEKKTGYRYWLQLADDPDAIIGTLALSSIVWGPFRSCFIGYKLDQAHLNCGLMTEAVKECVRIGFEEIGLHRIEANIMPKNKASLRVAEKAKFVCEGISKEYLSINGVWEDHIHMVILNHNLKAVTL